MEGEDGWVPLGAVGNQLANLASDFDPRHLAFASSAISCGRRMPSKLTIQKAGRCEYGSSGGDKTTEIQSRRASMIIAALGWFQASQKSGNSALHLPSVTR
jgi:hypothetical protein